jgi:hypothetical protein
VALSIRLLTLDLDGVYASPMPAFGLAFTITMTFISSS